VCVDELADLKLEAKFMSSEAVEQQVDAVVDVHEAEAERLEEEVYVTRRRTHAVECQHHEQV